MKVNKFNKYLNNNMTIISNSSNICIRLSLNVLWNTFTNFKPNKNKISHGRLTSHGTTDFWCYFYNFFLITFSRNLDTLTNKTIWHLNSKRNHCVSRFHQKLEKLKPLMKSTAERKTQFFSKSLHKNFYQK